MCTYSKAVTCLTAASLWVIGFWLKQICLFAIFAQPKANFNFCRYAVNHMQLLQKLVGGIIDRGCVCMAQYVTKSSLDGLHANKNIT